MNLRSSDMDDFDEAGEVLYDPHGPMGLMLAETTPAPSSSSDPLEMLIALEDMLLQEHGVTLLRAAKLGVDQLKRKGH